MRKVAIVRGGTSPAEELLLAIARCPIQVVDVCCSSDIRGWVEITNEGPSTRVTIGGVPVDEYARVLYFGCPRIIGVGSLSTQTQTFARTEWEAFLASALLLSTSDVLGLASPNAGPLPFGRYRSFHLLCRAGWEVASVGAADDRTPPQRPAMRCDYFTAVFTPKRWLLAERDGVEFENLPALERALWATWEALARYRIAVAHLVFSPTQRGFSAERILEGTPSGLRPAALASIAYDLVY